MSENTEVQKVSRWDALALLQKVIRRTTTTQPDYVYPFISGCYNTRTNPVTGEWEGYCVVGQVFVELGVEPAHGWRYGSSDGTIQRFKDRFEFEPEAEMVLRMAQIMQDNGTPWKVIDSAIEDVMYSATNYGNKRVNAARKALGQEAEFSE